MLAAARCASSIRTVRGGPTSPNGGVVTETAAAAALRTSVIERSLWGANGCVMRELHRGAAGQHSEGSACRSTRWRPMEPLICQGRSNVLVFEMSPALLPFYGKVRRRKKTWAYYKLQLMLLEPAELLAVLHKEPCRKVSNTRGSSTADKVLMLYAFQLKAYVPIFNSVCVCVWVPAYTDPIFSIEEAWN